MPTSLRPIILQDQAEPASPPAGSAVLYSVDGTALLLKDSDGTVRTIGPGSAGGSKISALPAVTTPDPADEFPVNDAGTTKKITLAQINGYTEPIYKASVAAQGPGFATDTYVTSSDIALPASTRQQAGMRYRCLIVVSKTAAGTATPIVNVRTGTAASTADTSRGTFTFTAGTAVIDTATIEVISTFRVVGASAVLQTVCRLTHNLSATGFINIPNGVIQATSGTFDSTAANLKIGVSVNGGTSAAWTVSQVQSELANLI